MSVLEFRKARESRNVVRTMLGKYLHIVLFTKTRYSSFLNHNFSKISNIEEQILLWGIIGEANFTFLNLKYEEIHISQPSVYFVRFVFGLCPKKVGVGGDAIWVIPKRKHFFREVVPYSIRQVMCIQMCHHKTDLSK